MKLYFAGNISYEEETALAESGGLIWRLLSYAEFGGSSLGGFEYWGREAAPAPYFLDSGAFSALTRGLTIDIGRYCSYIEENINRINPYASLDVIGDWRGSARNYDLMRKRCLEPVPTFHQGSPITELERLIKEVDYIALGGMVGSPRDKVKVWLDSCWNVIRKHWPKKVHSFGNTSPRVLLRYPWYSADSSSAIITAGLGCIADWDGTKMLTRHYSDYSRRYMNATGLDKVSPYSQPGTGTAYTGRRLLNVGAQRSLERHVTDIWKIHGITWED